MTIKKRVVAAENTSAFIGSYNEGDFLGGKADCKILCSGMVSSLLFMFFKLEMVSYSDFYFISYST